MNTPIHDFLTKYSAENFTRCHTPGTKGRLAVDSSHDITEISGAASLYEDTNVGIIAQSEATAAEIFGASKTLYSCTGSTTAIQTMLALVKSGNPGGNSRIAAFRYAHRSFASTAALLGLEVDWIYPDKFVSAAVSPESIKAAIKPDTAAVFLNSLDYYGGSCNIAKAAEICTAHKIPLLVDNAQGAYLCLTDKHPMNLGAAMSADSAHKTLPALTGAAYLHINDSQFTENSKPLMALFGTSSPSYLILESLDLCNRHIAELKLRPVAAFELVADLKRELSAIGFSLMQSDLLRITVNARDSGYSGVELAGLLRQNKVECEYADENCTVLLFSTVTDERDTRAVKAAFAAIKPRNSLPPITYPVLNPKPATSIRQSVFSKAVSCDIASAVGAICAEIIAPCPPGIPLIMPGEIIGRDEAELLKSFGVRKIRVIT
ncbi:MAG: aminotransferase class V-fold PLP-dependent enzyme [Oscillospiraceae bacterium]|nr:aminotransferase class V-fold PLP-dependent enzyme [Oscillospiraceae bacterium]